MNKPQLQWKELYDIQDLPEGGLSEQQAALINLVYNYDYKTLAGIFIGKGIDGYMSTSTIALAEAIENYLTNDELLALTKEYTDAC